MPRNYVKKRPPPPYTSEDLARAVQVILNRNRTYAEVEQFYNIPKSIVFNRMKGRHRPIEKLGAGRALSLSREIERDLENCIRARARMGCPCSKDDVKAVVAEYVQSNNLKTPFVNGIPGDDWYYSFMGRHPGLSFKKPELLQKCRKDARDPFVIYNFYKELAQLIKENSLEDHPSFVFNCDESGFGHDPTKCKAIGEKGKPLFRISGGSGRESTTVLACVSADGSRLPPMIVFKGVGVQARWTSEKAYPGTTYTCSNNGWMEEPQFFEWFSSVFLSHVQSLRLPGDLLDVGPSPKSIQTHATPRKDTEEHETHLTPNTIIDIFAHYSNRGQSDPEKISKVQRQIIPTLKPLKYGEILTTQEVLDKLETAQNLRNEKRPKRKATNSKSNGKSKNKKKMGSASHKQDNEPPSYCEIDESAICKNLSDADIDIAKTIATEATPVMTYHLPIWETLEPGFFVLVNFLGGRRNKVNYKYVCRVQETDVEDGEIVVQGFEHGNESATEFSEKQNDLSSVTFNMIEAILPEPSIVFKNRQQVCVFPGSVAVFEK